MMLVAGVLRAELCKLLSVRSTYWTLGLAVLFNVGLAALLAIFLPDQLGARDKATLDTTRVSLGGIHLAQVAFGVMGVLLITSEYTTGSMRTSLSAVPRRWLLLGAKAGVFAAITLAVGAASCFAAFFAFQAAVSDDALRAELADPGAVRTVAGGALYLTLLGLMGLGIGAIVRSSAGAIAGLLSLLFVPPVLLELLPRSWQTTVGPYAPMQAGAQMYSGHSGSDALPPWVGLGVFGLYVIAALALAFVLIDRRDA